MEERSRISPQIKTDRVRFVSKFVSNSVFREYFYVSGIQSGNQSESISYAHHRMDELEMDEKP